MIEPIYLRAFAAIILLLVVAIVVAVLPEREANQEAFKNSPSKRPMMTLELPEKLSDISENVGDRGDARRALMLKSLSLDSLLFIPSYTFFFLAMGWLLTQRRFSWALWLGVIAMACGIGAAIFDYMENAHIRALLETRLAETTQGMINSTRYISLCKWALSFIAAGLLSTLFWWRREWILLLGCLYALTALLGLAGLFYRPVLGWAFMLLGIGALGVIVVFLIFAPKFLEEL